MAADPVPLETLNKTLEPLNDWPNSPSIQDLKYDFEQAKRPQQAHIARVNHWLDNLNMTGSAKFTPKKGRSGVQPKLIRKQAEWQYTDLTEPFLSSDKLFSLKPVSWEDTKAVNQNELLLNWQFDTKIRKINFIDQYARTLVDEGTVAVRTGWDREVIEVEVDVPVYAFFAATDPRVIEGLQAGAQLRQENPNAYMDLSEDVRQAIEYSLEKGAAYQARLLRTEKVKQQKVIRNQPTVEVFEIANLFVDPSCGDDYEKALYICITREVTYGELKRDKRYKNLDAVNWEGVSVLMQPDHVTSTPQDFQFKDKNRKKTIMTEYWGYFDINNDNHLEPVVFSWIGDVMIRAEENPYPDKKPPFVIVPLMPIKKSIYGEPNGELLEDNQKIQGAITRGMIDLMGRSANAQRGMAKSMLDAVNRRKFDNGDDYEFNPNIHPSQGVVEHKFPEIPQSAGIMLQMVTADSESLTGVKTYDQGISSASLGQVAAGIRGVLDATSRRGMGILRRAADGMARVGSKILAMNQEFLSAEEVIRVTNEDFITVRRDDIQGNFDIKVAIATADEDNAKANDLSFMLQTMGNNMDAGMSKMILSKIARLRRMPDLAHAIETFQPQPDPLAQREQMARIALLEAQVAETQTGAQKNQAQANNQNAQAGLNQSKKDKTDLDYVEQETGTTHARDIDRISQQSEANANADVTKGILQMGKKDGPSVSAIQAAVGFNQVAKIQVQ